MEKKIENDQKPVIFDRFFKIKLVNCEWFRETHAFVTINKTTPEYFNNNGDQHAEERIVDERLSKSPTNTEAKIVINYSPCARCSKHINTFLTKRPDVKLEIVFAGLYKIDRIVLRPDENIKTDPSSTDNINGLKDLSQNVVALRNFRPEDWKNLWNNLGLETMPKDQRSAMWKSILEDKRQKFPSQDEVVKKRLIEDAYVKLELEIMLAGMATRNLMDFFNQEPLPSLPEAGAEVGLDEKFGGMRLNEEAQETPKDRGVKSP